MYIGSADPGQPASPHGLEGVGLEGRNHSCHCSRPANSSGGAGTHRADLGAPAQGGLCNCPRNASSSEGRMSQLQKSEVELAPSRLVVKLTGQAWESLLKGACAIAQEMRAVLKVRCINCLIVKVTYHLPDSVCKLGDPLSGLAVLLLKGCQHFSC